MPENFGARLRQQRERNDISLALIVGQTKISARLFEGLECGDLSHWPQGIYRKAYVRAYAKCIGLDPEATVREFAALYPDPQEDEAILAAQLKDAQRDSRPPTRLKTLLTSAAGSFARRPAGEERTSEPPPPVPVPQAQPSELLAVADLCSALGHLNGIAEATSLFNDIARLLDAIGFVIWVWNGPAAELRPLVAHGYRHDVLARLPRVRADADNATANAFRTLQPAIVAGHDGLSGAIAVPLVTLGSAVGVFAIELRGGGAQIDSVRAMATILASPLAPLVASPELAAVVNA